MAAVLTPQQLVRDRARKAAEYHEDGATDAQIARALGTSVAVVRDLLMEAKRYGPQGVAAK